MSTKIGQGRGRSPSQRANLPYRYYGRTVRLVLGEEDPDPEDYHYKEVGIVSVENEGFEYL